MAITIEDKVTRLVAYADVVREHGPIRPADAARRVGDEAPHPYRWLSLLESLGIARRVLVTPQIRILSRKERGVHVAYEWGALNREEALRVITENPLEQLRRSRRRVPLELSTNLRERAVRAAASLEKHLKERK